MILQSSWVRSDKQFEACMRHHFTETEIFNFNLIYFEVYTTDWAGGIAMTAYTVYERLSTYILWCDYV